MVQPYNYSLGVPSPQESFLAGLQMAQRQQQITAEREQSAARVAAEQAKIERARQFAVRAQDVAKDPSPEKLSALYADFTEYGADIDRFAKNLNEADKRTYGSILQNAIIAKDAGKTDEEISLIYKKGAETARNSNRLDIAEKFDAAAQMAMIPDMDDNFAARSLLNRFDPEGYKVLYENKKEPFIISNGMAFLRAPLERLGADTEKLMNGSMTAEQYDSVWGAGKAEKYIKTGTVDVAPTIPRPKNKEEFDKLPPGIEFIAPDGVKRRKPGQGGQTETPSGTFQGQ